VYGFLKDSGYFRHPYFLRDDPDSLSKVVKVYHQSALVSKKKKSSATLTKQAKDNADDDDDDDEVDASESSVAPSIVDDDSHDADDDASSTLVDYDLSTYATMETEQQSDVEHVQNADEKSAEQDQDDPQPKPKYQIHQRVYARDKDGVMYEAVVRRRLFGPTYHKQVEMGLVTTKQEAEEALAEQDLQPIWHYFVHFNNWNVRFDRFVSEHDVYEITDEVKTYAEQLMKEHKALQIEMRKPATKNKKSWQTIDGAAFLREWKKRRARVERELNWEGCNSTDSTQKDTLTDSEIAKASSSNQKNVHADQNTWTKAALALEIKLREKSLSTKRPQTIANAIALPFALKKVMVEQWEIISQCKMMPSLPTAVTIRQALDKYLESKNAVATPQNSGSKSEEEGVVSMNPDSLKLGSESNESQVLVNKEPSGENAEPTDGEDSEMEARKQEWRDMANGIAMLFDEALDSWLLYKEELPQLRVIDNIPEYSMKPYSEIYGCEHLLRLFVRLPEMLMDQISDSEARPIFAKVNDFVRFLHKNYSTLFTQTHRKLNEAEIKEQQKLEKSEERKRKALHEDNSISIGNKKSRETQEAR
jgi:mortality factor 4-like protein 1